MCSDLVVFPLLCDQCGGWRLGLILFHMSQNKSLHGAKPVRSQKGAGAARGYYFTQLADAIKFTRYNYLSLQERSRHFDSLLLAV